MRLKLPVQDVVSSVQQLRGGHAAGLRCRSQSLRATREPVKKQMAKTQMAYTAFTLESHEVCSIVLEFDLCNMQWTRHAVNYCLFNLGFDRGLTVTTRAHTVQNRQNGM